MTSLQVLKTLIPILFCLTVLCLALVGCRRSARSDQPQENAGGTATLQKMVPKGRCDMAIVSRTASRIDLLRDEDVYEFLFTFSNDCKDNVEYSEFSNEVLFKVLLQYPELLSGSLNKDSLYKDVILQELASPVIEAPIDRVINAVNKLGISDSARNKILRGVKGGI
ncbi:MAG: hypothetical protein ABI477_10350 [Chryseolinea sp.]